MNPVKKIDEYKYKIDMRDSLAFIKGDYEIEERIFFRKILNNYDIVVDGGANMGFHTVLFADLAKEVHAFDPIEECYKICNDNLKLNGLSANVIPRALSDKNMNIKLYTYEEANVFTSKYSSVSDQGLSNDSQFVKSITLDNYFERRQAPTFIKLDIEGMQKEALEGARILLSTHKPKLFLEIHPAFVNVSEFIEWVKRVGYKNPMRVGGHNYYFEPI